MRSQGARFEGDLDWEPNFNQGEYAGKQTFMMDAEATFGLVLVPDGSFEELTAQRSVSGDPLLLCTRS